MNFMQCQDTVIQMQKNHSKDIFRYHGHYHGLDLTNQDPDLLNQDTTITTSTDKDLDLDQNLPNNQDNPTGYQWHPAPYKKM